VVTTLGAGQAGARIPAGARNFSLPRNFHTGFSTQRSPYSMGNGRVLQRVKRPDRKADHSPPSILVVKNEWSYTSNSLCVHSVDRNNFNFFTEFFNFLVNFQHQIYLLTPWSIVLLEKLNGFKLVNKFPTFYGTRKFITAFKRARYLSLS